MAKGKPKSEWGINGRPTIWNEETAKIFGDKLLRWSERDDSIVLGSFGATHPHDPDCIYDLSNKYDWFRLIKNKAVENIGTRREKMAFLGKGNAMVWNRTARFYDKRLDKQLNKETYNTAYNDTKGRLAGANISQDSASDILKYLASQKL